MSNRLSRTESLASTQIRAAVLRRVMGQAGGRLKTQIVLRYVADGFEGGSITRY